jgi:hypothetical protein
MMWTSWYQMFKGNRGLPKSGREGVLMAQSVLAPWQAEIALRLGIKNVAPQEVRQALFQLTSGTKLRCEECFQVLTEFDFSMTEAGNHSARCDLAKQALEVTKDEFEPNQIWLTAERDRLKNRLAEYDRRLQALDERKRAKKGDR